MEKVERTYQDWLKVKAGEDWVVYLPAGVPQGAGLWHCTLPSVDQGAWRLPSLGRVHALTADKKEMELGWAHVDIRLRRKAKGDLRPVGGLPFAADKSKAIPRAQKELKEKGKFHDLLPANSYTIDGHNVSLGPDSAISRVSVVNIDQKGDGSFQLQPKPGPWNYLRTSGEFSCSPWESKRRF